MRRAIQQQVAVVEAYPSSEAARAFKSLAAKADKWNPPRGVRGHVEFFVERLIQASSSAGGGLQ
jgi:flagellar biosynthesis protein FlhG